MNHALALTVVLLLIVWIVLELGWGGGSKKL